MKRFDEDSYKEPTQHFRTVNTSCYNTYEDAKIAADKLSKHLGDGYRVRIRHRVARRVYDVLEMHPVKKAK